MLSSQGDRESEKGTGVRWGDHSELHFVQTVRVAGGDGEMGK